MTNLLIRLFVRNRENVSDPIVRSRYATLSGFTGILVNVLLFAAKLVIGLLASSVSIIADAFNNISDAGSSVVTLIGFRLSTKHADEKHPLGHGRLEYISAFIVNILIILVGIELFQSSLDKILHPSLPSVNTVTLIVLAIAVAVKLWLFLFYRHIAKCIQSPAIQASALDSISDVVATTLVLVSAVITRFANIQIDGIAGILVACFILMSGIKAARETIELLLGASPDPQLVEDIYTFVKSCPEIIGIHDVMIHDYGPGRQIASFHAEVPSDSDLCYAHDVIDELEHNMQVHFGCIFTIHMDPIVVNDERVNEMRRFAQETAAEVDPDFTIHDFRMTDGGKIINMIFDLCIPTTTKLEDAEAAELVAQRIREKNPICRAVIRAEHPFV